MDYLESYGKEKDLLFHTYLASKQKSTSMLEMHCLLGIDSLVFLTLFAGKTVVFPGIKKLKKWQMHCNIYVDSLHMCDSDVAKKYKIGVNDVKKISEEVSTDFNTYHILKSKNGKTKLEEAYELFIENRRKIYE